MDLSQITESIRTIAAQCFAGVAESSFIILSEGDDITFAVADSHAPVRLGKIKRSFYKDASFDHAFNTFSWMIDARTIYQDPGRWNKEQVPTLGTEYITLEQEETKLKLSKKGEQGFKILRIIPGYGMVVAAGGGKLHVHRSWMQKEGDPFFNITTDDTLHNRYLESAANPQDHNGDIEAPETVFDNLQSIEHWIKHVRTHKHAC